jgi:hypothetical protein
MHSTIIGNLNQGKISFIKSIRPGRKFSRYHIISPILLAYETFFFNIPIQRTFRPKFFVESLLF